MFLYCVLPDEINNEKFSETLAYLSLVGLIVGRKNLYRQMFAPVKVSRVFSNFWMWKIQILRAFFLSPFYFVNLNRYLSTIFTFFLMSFSLIEYFFSLFSSNNFSSKLIRN